ncbi:succinate-semialdehyde dehydrogenase/glutarate-semialdehyde dehydrogenase [Methanomicrobium sp. W14]|uniref:aldehyde dehydrogenase family protein n=1 Tax=Methanomicrobium sp. W14 TaxID=2817839 RepID=UPI001AE8DDFE|nr:aldehyde dehydrogenase family protein [Methanomicrobium sp. W14]MBP2134080.1 succinate-semialdehyde dehydrogenase/glutarate-semialdehyde dehydrogenase [Methanomicrobium sp. W14]
MTEGEKRYLDVINPATGETVGSVPEYTTEDVSGAVDRAEGGFFEWSEKSVRFRSVVLFRAAELVREEQGRLSELLTSEQGKILPEAKNEVQGFANVLEYYASISGTVAGDAFPKSDYGYAFTKKEPLGVCGAIIPWNMPVLIMAWKVGPALAAGNSLVLKPSGKTPLTAIEISKIMKKAGLPEGVLEIVTGRGETTGRAVAENRKISALSFTGSVRTGDEIEKKSCGTKKRLTLELGGSDPMVVCSDADIDMAVSGAASGRFYNCGQTCTAVKRLFLFEDIADEFIEKLKTKTAAIRVGNGHLKGVRMGPMNSQKGLSDIERIIDESKRGGDEILSGGNRLTGAEFESGNFFEPTIIKNPYEKSNLLNEEIFGPVLPVVVVGGMDEAVEYANKTKFGLGASVWTKSLKNAYSFSDSVDAGIVWVNKHLKIPPEVPFGGEKASGTGRENGLSALDRYMREKTVIISP